MTSFKCVAVGRFLSRLHEDIHRLASPFSISPMNATRLSTSAPINGKHVSLKMNDEIAVVTIDSPDAKVNSLSKEVMEEMAEVLQKLWNDDAVKGGVLISGKPGCFIAGADIKMLQGCKTKEEAASISSSGQMLLDKVAASPKPIVAAIKGSCMGGGLEVALACQYRLAVKDKTTTLSLPEVMLGNIDTFVTNSVVAVHYVS
jgi:enoyl-CoA hydratase/long-chain 3-hydroxyacyl-CoA dehydrogenase